jgi:hypothetical protein
VRPSVIISPTDFIAVTDGISPSVKLVNGVVEKYIGRSQILKGFLDILFYFFLDWVGLDLAILIWARPSLT